MRRLLAALALAGCGLHLDVLSERAPSDAAVVDAPIEDGASDGVLEDTPPTSGASVGAGQYHACAIRAGALFCWGNGLDGALGLGDTNDRSRPTRVPLAKAWVDVVGGEHHTCARTAEGELYCFGANDLGQLGVADTVRRTTPVKVPIAAVAQVASGFDFTCAITTDRALFCWGENVEGQLGQSDAYPGAPSSKPLRVGKDADWTRITTGQGHACGIRAPGSLFCWGRNAGGELGLGPGSPIQIRTPTRVGALSDWVDVEAGQDTTCAIRVDGSLWCWGDNDFGQAGAPPSARIDAPRRAGTESDFLEVSVDTFSTCARKRGNTLWCWGRNVEGALGLGDYVDRSTPTAVSGADWLQVSVGRFHTCARKIDGSIWCTGDNRNGQLGQGDGTRRNAFARAL